MTAALAAAAVLVLAGCVTTRAPSGWLPNADKVGEDPYGSWVEIQSDGAALYGELIAVEQDALYLMRTAELAKVRRGPEAATRVNRRGRDPSPPERDVLQVIARSDVQELHLFWYDSDYERLGLITVTGMLGTISHGVALVFTAPIWLLSGIAIAGKRSRDPRVTYPETPWASLGAYARFPQGMPRSEIDDLAPRPR